MVLNKKFELELEEINDDKEKYKIKRMLTEDRTLSMVLVSAYFNEPATITEISNLCSKINLFEVDRSVVWRKIKVLSNIDLVKVKHITDVLSHPDGPEDDLIRQKWRKFLTRFEGNPLMVKRFKSMSFVIVTKKGEKFIEWAIEKHKLPFKLKKKVV